ncbi:MAG: hypothetical protein JNL52_14270 [Flavobacteriales bacterium]|nr:hypothetical protein [Flavobacteriales bacterium]
MLEQEREKHGPALDPVTAERGFRKLYVHFGLRVLAGVGVLALMAVLPLPSKWWGLPLLLIGAWLILANLGAISVLVNAHYRYRHGPEDTTPLEFQEGSERFVQRASYAVLFVTMAVMVPFSSNVENMVEEGRFVLLMGGVGVLVAAFVLWLIKCMVPGYYQRNSEARGGAVLGLFFSVVVLVLLGTAWIDRSSAQAHITVVRCALEDGARDRSGSRYVHVFHPGQASSTFRIQLRGKDREALSGRDSVDFLLGRGDLGFTHVLGVVQP